MPRILPTLIIAVIALVLAVPAGAFESEETQQVRDLLYKAKRGWYDGDATLVTSCFAEGAVWYQAMDNPEIWSIVAAGLDSLRAMQSDANVKNGAQTWASHPQWRRDHEVLHIQIKGDYAVATTQHWEWKPDPVARENLYWESKVIWMLSKIKGEWKVTSVIGGVDSHQQVQKWNPE